MSRLFKHFLCVFYSICWQHMKEKVLVLIFTDYSESPTVSRQLKGSHNEYKMTLRIKLLNVSRLHHVNLLQNVQLDLCSRSEAYLWHRVSQGNQSSTWIPCCGRTTPTGSGNIHKTRRIMSPTSCSNLPLCLEALIVYLSYAKSFTASCR